MLLCPVDELLLAEKQKQRDNTGLAQNRDGYVTRWRQGLKNGKPCSNNTNPSCVSFKKSISEQALKAIV